MIGATRTPGRHARACPGHPRLGNHEQGSRGWPGHRQAGATPSFGRLCLAMTFCESNSTSPRKRGEVTQNSVQATSSPLPLGGKPVPHCPPSALKASRKTSKLPELDGVVGYVPPCPGFLQRPCDL